MKNKNNNAHRTKAETNMPMKIPFGESNFRKIVILNFLYIDKTGLIETLEQQGNFNIHLRPRRFGKSLFLSMLHHYYDIRFKDEFPAPVDKKRTTGETIGQHKRKLDPAANIRTQ